MVIVPLSSLQNIKSVETTSEVASPKLSFSQIFEEALNNARETQTVAENDSTNLSLGKAENLTQVMINSAKATAALQLTVEMTSRAVSSYKEIMQMQV